MNKIIEQMNFCSTLTSHLSRSVNHHEEYRKKRGAVGHSWLGEYGSGIAENGASKTQIQASIVQLRRELNILSKMLED